MCTYSSISFECCRISSECKRFHPNIDTQTNLITYICACVLISVVILRHAAREGESTLPVTH